MCTQDEKRALEETVNAFSSQPQFQGDQLQGDLDNGLLVELLYHSLVNH